MKFPLAILIALQVGDFFTTAYDMHHGTGREGNPLLAAALASFGVIALVIAKAVTIGSIVGLYRITPPRARRITDFVFRAGAIGTALAVYGNLIVGGLV